MTTAQTIIVTAVTAPLWMQLLVNAVSSTSRWYHR
ncbi:hypothetical protein MSIMFI_04921 [Mycobacterium simulans]|nr:hypothetical protein MSIMFI_04921 [Mycobacterium simulans]